MIEPQAPAVADRLANISQLSENKIPFEVRADPIIPELTDTRENIQNLFEAIARRGARRVVTSHVFLRPGNMGPLSRVRLRGFRLTRWPGDCLRETLIIIAGIIRSGSWMRLTGGSSGGRRDWNEFRAGGGVLPVQESGHDRAVLSSGGRAGRTGAGVGGADDFSLLKKKRDEGTYNMGKKI